MQQLVIHTTDTPYNRDVRRKDILQWHLLPKRNDDGTITYKGKKYASKDELPDEKIEGLDIRKNVNGRGWKVPGYSDMIYRDGTLENIVPYNFDDVIDSAEVTNGATGYNSNSRHVVLAGGWSKDGTVHNGKHRDGSYFRAEDLYTPEQIKTLVEYIEMQREMVPGLKVVGHNELSLKTCPNFDVQQFLREHGLK